MRMRDGREMKGPLGSDHGGSSGVCSASQQKNIAIVTLRAAGHHGALGCPQERPYHAGRSILLVTVPVTVQCRTVHMQPNPPN